MVIMSSGDHIVTQYDMDIIRCDFSFRFQWQWSLCHPETILLQNMIWSSSGVIFHFAFSGNDDYAMLRVLPQNMIWSSSVVIFHFTCSGNVYIIYYDNAPDDIMTITTECKMKNDT